MWLYCGGSLRAEKGSQRFLPLLFFSTGGRGRRDDLEIGRANLALAKRRGDANQVVSTLWGGGGGAKQGAGDGGGSKARVNVSSRFVKKTEG